MSSITEKLAKLIAMEKSARSIGNLAEAEAFAGKVAQLLFQHNLQLSEIEIAEQERDEPIERERIDILGKRRRAAWLEELASAVAQACFCRQLIVPGTTIQVFVGRTSDRQSAIALFSHLAGIAQSMCNKEARNAKSDNPHVGAMSWYAQTDARLWGREWRQSWLRGFVDAIGRRLRAEVKQLDATSTGAALVLRKDAALQQYMKDRQHKRVAAAIRSQAGNAVAYRSGHSAGNSVSLKSRAALTA
jgi:hypothetical protein